MQLGASQIKADMTDAVRSKQEELIRLEMVRKQQQEAYDRLSTEIRDKDLEVQRMQGTLTQYDVQNYYASLEQKGGGASIGTGAGLRMSMTTLGTGATDTLSDVSNVRSLHPLPTVMLYAPHQPYPHHNLNINTRVAAETTTQGPRIPPPSWASNPGISLPPEAFRAPHEAFRPPPPLSPLQGEAYLPYAPPSFQGHPPPYHSPY
jgi:hypothetical protein